MADRVLFLGSGYLVGFESILANEADGKVKSLIFLGSDFFG